jgi:mannose-6-phosphate isomerase
MADRFDRSWGAAQSPDGRRDSPGLQFAAAAQLETWGRRRGDESARRAASRLYEAGCLGMGGYSGGAADEPDGKFGRLGVSLCTQAERLRAAAAFARGSGAPRGHYQTEAIEASRALRRYLDTPVRGSWRDTLGNDGRFSFGPTSSENLFHIVAAAGQLGLAVRETDAAAAPVAGGAAYRRSVRFAAFGRARNGLADREAR